MLVFNSNVRLKDSDIRPALLDFIKREHPLGYIKQELNISDGFVRADVGVISNELHGYEIKSDADSLRRLVTQGICYSTVFTTATLVTTETHVEKSLDILPEWWRILLVDSNLEFKVFREGEPNYEDCSISLIQLLKEREAKELIRFMGLTSYLTSDHNSILKMLLNTLSEDEIKFLVCIKLKARYRAFNNSGLY